MKKDINEHFMTLVLSIATAVMQHLGKLPNPQTGKIERDITQAKLAIEMLLMLKEKTKNNLTSDEETFLSNTLADLELNYIDELKKEKEQIESKH